MVEDDVVWARWEEIDRLFARVLEHPEDERLVLLRRICGDDQELEAAVLELLQDARTEDPRVTSPGRELLSLALPRGDDESLAAGDAVGRYRILGELGRGGMATVYEAERRDGAYQQVVALKVLRRGLDTGRIIDRFLTERQILSDFAHPHIARLLDGGATSDGRPFLVMERVRGEPVTVWADAHGLDLVTRLELFLQVAEAVKEAHRRLVVHRDLKPANVLVDDAGQVKLLDFGIAKLLQSESSEGDLTELSGYPLTRRWASPEQLRGEAVTTSSDIYQLGLILFWLLVGRSPFDDEPGMGAGAAPFPSRAFREIGEAERGRVATARSTTDRALQRALQGDLDTIVGKALEPQPEDRYPSVEDLVEDVRRHLEGRPIRARPAPWSLRVRKWIGRNRWAPPVAALLFLAAAGYVTTLSLTAQRLERERNDARAQAERAELIKGFLIDIFRSANPWDADEGGARADVTVAEVLSAAPLRIRNELDDDPGMQADLLAAVASILTDLDRSAEGRPLIEQALELRRSLGQEGTPPYAADLQILGDIIGPQSPDTATELLTRAIGILEDEVPPADPRLADALHSLFWHQYSVLRERDPSAGERALEIYRSAGPGHRQAVAGILGTLAQVYSSLGRLDDAEAAAEEAVRLRSEGLGDQDTRTAIAKVVLAQVMDAQHRFEAAIPLYRGSLEVLERTVGPEHNQTLTVKNNLATTLYATGRLDEAIGMHREILDLWRRKAGTDNHRSVAESLQNLATALKDAGRLREADSLTIRAYEIYVATTPEGYFARAFPLLTRTEILLRSGEPARAEAVAVEALAILENALPSGHYAIGVARCRLGMAVRDQGRRDEAVPHLAAGLEIMRGDPRTPVDYRTECERAGAATPDRPRPPDEGPGS